jgi:hypothetical protein
MKKKRGKLPSAGRLWWLFNYNRKRGWGTAWMEYHVMPQILRWRVPVEFQIEDRVEIHLLTSGKDWLYAAWMLASFFHFTRRRWRVVVHEDGTCDPDDLATLSEIIPDLRVIRRVEADIEMETRLAAFPACQAYRQEHALAMKIFDVPAMARTPRVLLLDSDVLFYRQPQEILDWVDRGAEETWFNSDFQHSLNISAEEALEKWGIKLWPLVNSGLVLLEPKILELDFCEACLVEGTIRTKGWKWCVEQTLFSLCASRAGRGGLLPTSKYEVSYSPLAAPDVTARHYVGFVRQQFFSEGLRRLQPVLLA